MAKNYFQILRFAGDLSATYITKPVYESICNEYGELDILAMRELCEDKNLTKHDMQAMFFHTFGAHPPARFKIIEVPANLEALSKEEFLELYYKPAMFLNAKLWVMQLYSETGIYIPRALIFNWIVSTCKPKVHAPEPEPLIG